MSDDAALQLLADEQRRQAAELAQVKSDLVEEREAHAETRTVLADTRGQLGVLRDLLERVDSSQRGTTAVIFLALITSVVIPRLLG